MTGPIYAEKAEEYLAKGYSLDAIVGISGIEKALEDELQGTAGVRTITFQSGEMISDEITTPVTAGHTVQLTVNSKFQKGLQKILDDFLNNFQTSYMEKRRKRRSDKKRRISCAGYQNRRSPWRSNCPYI